MKKTIFFIATIVSVMFGKQQTITLQIKGMTCPLCTSAVKKTLRLTKGVISTKVLLNKKTATVVYDDKITSPKQLIASITKIGYTATTKEKK